MPVNGDVRLAIVIARLSNRIELDYVLTPVNGYNNLKRGAA